MSMRAASSLYVHPELTDSEVWYKPASSTSTDASTHSTRTSNAVFYAAIATFSLATVSTFTVLHLTNIGKLIQDSPFVQRWL
ncbi:hypothetical protein APHAL10511_004742 [Amanita phalloides]|nr:hypothetical protein APHAL10511_004742 [Amanita phalloides]